MLRFVLFILAVAHCASSASANFICQISKVQACDGYRSSLLVDSKTYTQALKRCVELASQRANRLCGLLVPGGLVPSNDKADN